MSFSWNNVLYIDVEIGYMGYVVCELYDGIKGIDRCYYTTTNLCVRTRQLYNDKSIASAHGLLVSSQHSTRAYIVTTNSVG